jgi:hypothetical protein
MIHEYPLVEGWVYAIQRWVVEDDGVVWVQCIIALILLLLLLLLL